jgi:hypothetical protein
MRNRGSKEPEEEEEDGKWSIWGLWTMMGGVGARRTPHVGGCGTCYPRMISTRVCGVGVKEAEGLSEWRAIEEGREGDRVIREGQ